MENRTQKAPQVIWIGFFVNLFLTTGKLLAGIIGHSTAMVADGVHSLSDFVTDIIVSTFTRISDKAIDESRHYGHGKFETFATLLISIALFLTGLGICWIGIRNIIKSFTGNRLEPPTCITLITAIVFNDNTEMTHILAYIQNH
jgi:cation diffusion facilitator family transporter